MTFRYKDYKRGQRLHTCTLEAVEFLPRLMLHVLPKGLHKVRYFGFFANRHRHDRLAHCRVLLGQSADIPVSDVRATSKATSEPTGTSAWIEPGDVCPACHLGHMHLVKAYYRHRAAWDLSIAAPQFDSS